MTYHDAVTFESQPQPDRTMSPSRHNLASVDRLSSRRTVEQRTTPSGAGICSGARWWRMTIRSWLMGLWLIAVGLGTSVQGATIQRNTPTKIYGEPQNHKRLTPEDSKDMKDRRTFDASKYPYKEDVQEALDATNIEIAKLEKFIRNNRDARPGTRQFKALQTAKEDLEAAQIRANSLKSLKPVRPFRDPPNKASAGSSQKAAAAGAAVAPAVDKSPDVAAGTPATAETPPGAEKPSEEAAGTVEESVSGSSKETETQEVAEERTSTVTAVDSPKDTETKPKSAVGKKSHESGTPREGASDGSVLPWIIAVLVCLIIGGTIWGSMVYVRRQRELME
ncbi:MAG: hypothetical protein IT581_22370 [Verrucomicrobiales bacterium]|nr:hypothetical protein [Verrucomicrobiales bacterium]